MNALVQRFRERRRAGTAVIEFALLAPFLVMLLLGVSDLAPTLMVKFKVGTATQAIADLAAQSAIVSPGDVPNLFAIGGDLMSPFDSAPLIQRVSNIASDGKKAFVYWSCGESTSLPQYDTYASVTTPTGLIDVTKADTSYVMVETQYKYIPPAGLVLKSAQVMTVTAYTLPRVSTYIGPSTGVLGYNPPKPSLAKNSGTVTINGVTCNYAN